VGDSSKVLAKPVCAHERAQAFAKQSEAKNERALRTLRDKAESDFLEGRTVTWTDVKTRNGL
jgi:hypothetical protein